MARKEKPLNSPNWRYVSGIFQLLYGRWAGMTMHESLGWPLQSGCGWGPRDLWDRLPTPKQIVDTEEKLIDEIAFARSRELQRHAKKMAAIEKAQGIVQRRRDDRLSVAKLRAEAAAADDFTAEEIHTMFVADLEVM